jgi:hypothetical protein
MWRNILVLTIISVALLTFAYSSSRIGEYFSQRKLVLSQADYSGVLGVSSIGNTPSRDLQAVKTVEPSYRSHFQSTTYHGYLFDRWLESKGSPLAGHGDDFVQACRQYGAPEDCTLLLGIAKVETNYCLTDISAQQYNCWGFGGSGPNRILYDSFEESIDEITRRLMTGYGAYFFRDPRNGGLVYCGAHCVNWGTYVRSEQNSLKFFLRENGLEFSE